MYGLQSNRMKFFETFARAACAEQKFSDVIRDAKEKGFTEPDPRDDLSGSPGPAHLSTPHPSSEHTCLLRTSRPTCL